MMDPTILDEPLELKKGMFKGYKLRDVLIGAALTFFIVVPCLIGWAIIFSVTMEAYCG